MSATAATAVASGVDLRAFLRAGRLFVLTGAGVSTASGIPGYRDADGNWARRQPVTHQAFTGSEAVRRRYWARSMAGWPVIAEARPNRAHLALATLETGGQVVQVVTQNVDGLHQRAGSRNVIDLHGRLDRVACLACGHTEERDAVQEWLLARNALPPLAAVAPDGDADVDVDLHDFAVPSCACCGGMVKPDVVFFGANVPRTRVDQAFAALEDAAAVLVVGTSLMAYSGYRFCEHAHAAGKPVVAINRGRTRADGLLAAKIEADCAEALAFVLLAA